MKSNSSFDPSLVFLTSSVYFVQGALSLSGVAFPLFLRGKGWGIAEIAAFSFLTGLPWALKLLYGAFSDVFPIQGLRRKPYLILASFLSFVSWLGLAFAPEDVFFLYGFAVFSNLGFAVTDVVTDALIVENSRKEAAQIYQSFAWGFRSLGAIIGGVLGGWSAQHFPYRWVFALTALLSVIPLTAAFFIHETKIENRLDKKNILNPLLESLQALWSLESRCLAGLLLVLSFAAAFSTPLFFFFREELKFSETFLGSLSSMAWTGAVLGCFFYGRFFKQIPIQKTLSLAVVLNVINILSTYGMRGVWSAAALSFLGGILAYLTLLPLMASAALLSRKKGIEGSLFALFMSIYNLGQILSTFLGGKLLDIIGLRRLIFLSAFVSLTGLIFVRQIKILKETGG